MSDITTLFTTALSGAGDTLLAVGGVGLGLAVTPYIAKRGWAFLKGFKPGS